MTRRLEAAVHVLEDAQPERRASEPTVDTKDKNNHSSNT